MRRVDSIVDKASVHEHDLRAVQYILRNIKCSRVGIHSISMLNWSGWIDCQSIVTRKPAFIFESGCRKNRIPRFIGLGGWDGTKFLASGEIQCRFLANIAVSNCNAPRFMQSQFFSECGDTRCEPSSPIRNYLLAGQTGLPGGYARISDNSQNTSERDPKHSWVFGPATALGACLIVWGLFHVLTGADCRTENVGIFPIIIP